MTRWVYMAGAYQVLQSVDGTVWLSAYTTSPIVQPVHTDTHTSTPSLVTMAMMTHRHSHPSVHKSAVHHHCKSYMQGTSACHYIYTITTARATCREQVHVTIYTRSPLQELHAGNKCMSLYIHDHCKSYMQGTSACHYIYTITTARATCREQVHVTIYTLAHHITFDLP